jgi:hypothetical protein
MNAHVRPVELNKPLLFIATEEHASDPGSRAREYSGSESNSYYVTVPDSDHRSFTDKRLEQSRFLADSQANTISWERALLAVEVTRSLVDEFFDKYLKGHSALSLDLPVHVARQ